MQDMLNIEFDCIRKFTEHSYTFYRMKNNMYNYSVKKTPQS